MNKFNKISIEGIRRLYRVDLEMRPLAVMIGANGVGKTSFLDVFAILAASAKGQLKEKISDLSGIGSLLTHNIADEMKFDLSMEVPHHAPLDYSIRVAPRGQSYAIEEEILSQRRDIARPPFKHIESHGTDIKYFSVEDNRLLRPNWEHDPFESSLSQVPKMFQEPEEFRKRLASSTFYHALNVEQRSSVRLPQPMRPAGLPGKDGEDLVSCLYYMRETDRSRFETIEDSLHAAFPGFERLDFPPVSAGTLAMTWKDKSFAKPIYTHQLSEGTLRFLWLVTLLQSKDLTAITLIDEPEVSLHPELLSLLAELMREASLRTQLVIATHSDRFVRFLNPGEVIVMDMSADGLSTMIWADKLDLDKWLSEYTLDEVWRLGRMGARA